MRIRFDKSKSERLRKNSKRGIGFEEIQEIFQHPYFEDCRSDDPEQFRAICNTLEIDSPGGKAL